MKYKMLVVNKEIIENSLVVHLNTVNSKGKPITKGRNSVFIEVWLPNFKSLNEGIKENITVFNVEFNIDYNLTRKNMKKFLKG